MPPPPLLADVLFSLDCFFFILLFFVFIFNDEKKRKRDNRGLRTAQSGWASQIKNLYKTKAVSLRAPSLLAAARHAFARFRAFFPKDFRAKESLFAV